MADVSQLFLDRYWSQKHVGPAKPVCGARIRRGEFHHGHRGPYRMLDGSVEDFATIAVKGENPKNPWSGEWVPRTAWMDLPLVHHFERSKSFDNNGIATATLEVENIFYQSIAGVLGTYTVWSRGYLSPWRGFQAPGRGRPPWEQVTEWYDMLQGSAQIEVYYGYGLDTMTKTFTGLVDDVDMTSSPDSITITMRDFGGAVLTEQRVFDTNKDPKIRAPVTFADRLSVDKLKRVGYNAHASSSDSSHPAKNVLDARDATAWESQDRGSADATEFVEIALPRGRYESFIIDPAWGGMEVYLSINVADRVVAHGSTPEKKAQVNDVDVNPGWYDAGLGTIPGTGVPFIKHWGAMDPGAHHDKMGGKYEVGDNTILRVTFRNLHKLPGNRWRAGARKLQGVSRKQNPDVKKNNWILVDDGADVVKVVLRWAGFREWEIESFGARLSKPWVFHQSDFFIDIINYVKSQGDYVFFMGDPTANDLSIGVPTFRHNRAIQDIGNETVYEFMDTALLTGTDLKLSAPPKAELIRVRGAVPPKGGPRGTVLGEDTSRLLSASYRPPWARSFGQAGINRFETHYDRNLATELDCRAACVLIAFQMALASTAGQIEVPGFPAVDLDQRIGITDEGTGLSSRMYVAQVSDTFTYTDSGGGTLIFSSTFGGALIDTEDIVSIQQDYIDTLALQAQMSDADRKKGGPSLKPVKNVWGN